MQCSNRVGFHNERCNAVGQKWAYLVQILQHLKNSIKIDGETSGLLRKQNNKQKACNYLPIKSCDLESLTACYQILYDRSELENWETGTWLILSWDLTQEWSLSPWKTFIIVHKTPTHNPRLIAGDKTIQTIISSNDENWTYLKNWLKGSWRGRRKVVLQVVLMILQTLCILNHYYNYP